MKDKIEVNALISFDRIKIIASAKSRNNIFCIHEEEIDLFNNDISQSSSEKRNEVKKAIKMTVETIKSKTSKNIKMINIIFDDFMKNSGVLSFDTKILEEAIVYNKEKFLNQEDCNNIIRSMVNKSLESETNKKLISIVPFRFIYVESGTTFEQESTHFPIGKKIKRLKIIFSIRYMDKKSYLKTIDYFDLVDIKINSVTLESQLSIYNKNFDYGNFNKINFTLAIESGKSLLISSVNNVVIKTDFLNFSYENLIKKLSSNFGISIQEAKNLINCYGKLNGNDENSSEIIYSAYSIGLKTSKPIRKSDVVDVIKSFLKSTCSQANEIINERINNIHAFNQEIKIIGELSNIEGVLNYCSKYFDNVNVSLNETKKSIYAWNRSLESIKNYWSYTQMLANKLRPETFYYNSAYVKEQSNLKKNQNFNVVPKDASKAILV